MKKFFLPLMFFLLSAALFAGCACQHEWTDASCTAAKACTKCGTSEGEIPGHCWKEADCLIPKTCLRCGLTEGDAPGHSWTEATCTTPKTCSVCTATEGQPLEHTWSGEATLYDAPFCAVCGTEGEPLPGYLAQNDLMPNTTPWCAADYITNTYVRPDLNTTGEFIASDIQVFEYDSTHRVKKGYEWRKVDISIRFSDNHSVLYGTNVTCARADYYQDQELKQADKKEQFSVNYKGQTYKCTASYENRGFHFTDTSNEFYMSCYVQVPVGYDGVVLAFYHGDNDIDGKHLHEVEDENMLLFRMA